MDEDAMYRDADEAALVREELAGHLERVGAAYIARARVLRAGRRDEPSLTADAMTEVLAVRLARLEARR